MFPLPMIYIHVNIYLVNCILYICDNVMVVIQFFQYFNNWTLFMYTNGSSVFQNYGNFGNIS